MYSPGDEYPMALVNWNDATAYAEWAGKRLPTEAEWKCVVRGELAGKRYPWGDESAYDMPIIKAQVVRTNGSTHRQEVSRLIAIRYGKQYDPEEWFFPGAGDVNGTIEGAMKAGLKAYPV